MKPHTVSCLARPQCSSAGCVQVQYWTIKDWKAESQSFTMGKNILGNSVLVQKKKLGALS